MYNRCPDTPRVWGAGGGGGISCDGTFLLLRPKMQNQEKWAGAARTLGKCREGPGRSLGAPGRSLHQGARGPGTRPESRKGLGFSRRSYTAPIWSMRSCQVSLTLSAKTRALGLCGSSAHVLNFGMKVKVQEIRYKILCEGCVA